MLGLGKNARKHGRDPIDRHEIFAFLARQSQTFNQITARPWSRAPSG